MDDFFIESTDQSGVKTTICTNYFFAWSGIITRKTRSDRVAYFDFYAGPGRYVDGTKSSPLLILERAIADARMRGMLMTLFNDAKPEHADSLENAIKSLPGLDRLKHQPHIITAEVGPAFVAMLEKPHIPCFAFIDPYGYKGLSLGLVNGVIKDWACECLFFFNYNRINPGISNPAVRPHMEALFGAGRLSALKEAVAGRKPAERERLVISALTEALEALGAKYVLPFRFKMRGSDRTSHYLIFVSKEFLGYQIMREVMGKASSSSVQGVPSFEYNPNAPLTPPLFDLSQPLDELVKHLATRFSPGAALTVEQVFQLDSPRKPYIMRNYKDALLRLEDDGVVVMTPPAEQRPKRKGKRTLADDVVVKFLERPGSLAKIAASRSTPGHRGDDRLPSVSARPTA